MQEGKWSIEFKRIFIIYMLYDIFLFMMSGFFPSNDNSLLVSLILLVTAYVVYKTLESTSPKNRMKRLETKAHKLYFTVKNQLEVDLEEQAKQLKNDGMPVRHRQNTEKTLASLKEYLQHIKGV